MTQRKRPLPLTDEDEADIQRQIAADPDDAEAGDNELAQALPFAVAMPALAESIRRSRGRPRMEAPKQQVSLRLSKSVIDKFKATGPGWQARINDVLEKAAI